MNSLVNSLDSGNEFGSSPIDSVIVTSSESMIVSVGIDTANNISAKNIDLAKVQTDSRYRGVELEPSKRLELTNEADSNPWRDPQFSLNTLASNSSILLLGVNDGVDTIEESQDILNQPFGLCNPFVDFNFVNFRGYLEMNYLDGSPISVFPEPELTYIAEPPAERLSFERLPIPLGSIPRGPARCGIRDGVWFGPISLLNPHPDIPLQPVLSEPDFTDSTEDELDKPVTLPSGPADGTFLGDGSDYPDGAVLVTDQDPGPPCYGPLEPEIIHFTITVVRPAEDGPDTPVTIPSGPADDTFLGDGSDYPDREVVVWEYNPYEGGCPRFEPGVIQIVEWPAEDGHDTPVTIPSGPADDTFLGDGSDDPDRGVWFEYLDPSWSRFVGFAERPAEGVPGKTWWKPLEPYQLQWCGVGSENLFTPIRLPLGPAEDVPETGYVPDKLWTITGNEMSIAEFGSTDQITRIKTAEGGTTYSTDIEKLVQAMACFAPPAAMQTSWTSGQTITGNILLAVSH